MKNESWMNDDDDIGAVAAYGCLGPIGVLLLIALYVWIAQ
jgi:hypothetical protein